MSQGMHYCSHRIKQAHEEQALLLQGGTGANDAASLRLLTRLLERSELLRGPDHGTGNDVRQEGPAVLRCRARMALNLQFFRVVVRSSDNSHDENRRKDGHALNPPVLEGPGAGAGAGSAG